MSNKTVLWFGDSPDSPSGLGTVDYGLMKNLMHDWDIISYAINRVPQTDRYNEMRHHVDFIDAKADNDVYGRRRFLEIIEENIFDQDVIFLFNDHFVLTWTVRYEIDGQQVEGRFIDFVRELADRHGSKVVTYFPVDAKPYYEWVQPLIKCSHVPITYTNWAKDQIDQVLKDSAHSEKTELGWLKKTKVLYHGVNKKDWHPISEGEKKGVLNQFDADCLTNSNFIIGYVGTNNVRKQIPRDVLEPFCRFAKEHEDATLFMKSKQIDRSTWNFPRLVRRITYDHGISENRIVSLNDPHTDYVNQEWINYMYNVCDFVYLPSMEGFGLPIVEAMATGTPTMVGDHAALSEIGAEGRSIKVDVPDDVNNRIYPIASKSMMRTNVDINDAVEKMGQAYEMGDEERQEMVEKAYDFVDDLSWDKIAEKLEGYFHEALEMEE